MQIEIVSVKFEDYQAPDEGVVYWVTARIGGRKHCLYGAPARDGRKGLVPCGDALQDWCDEWLIERFGYERANELGREALAKAVL